MDKAIYSQHEVTHVVSLYKKLLKKKKIPFDALILFGSYARGSARPWSDIDVAVIGKHFGKNPIKDGVLLDTIADEVSLAIEPHPINSRDYLADSDPFIIQIKRYGKKIR